MNYEKQVNRSHYDFLAYYSKGRWTSLWHQIDEILRLEPATVLEVGGGLGILKEVMQRSGIEVTMVDIADDLCPDIVGSVTSLPLEDGYCDVSCAFQVLEHLPLEKLPLALTELGRVAKRAVVFSVPNAKQCYASKLSIPKLGAKDLWITRPKIFGKMRKMCDQHYWEINRNGVDLDTMKDVIRSSGLELVKEYRVVDMPYHHFFVLLKK